MRESGGVRLQAPDTQGLDSMFGQKTFLLNSLGKSWENFLFQVIICFLRIPRDSQFTGPTDTESRKWLCHDFLPEKCELKS